ncbi:hypothetical protein V2J09_008707 [Rumex salicifolius]
MSMTHRRVGRSSTVAAKRTTPSSENVAVGKASARAPAPLAAAKKRPPLGNLTNQRPLGTSSFMIPCAASKVVNSKKVPFTNPYGNAVPVLLNSKSNSCVAKSNENQPCQIVTLDASVDMDISSPSSPSSGISLSLDESMSTTDSMKSPEVEYLDDSDLTALNSVHRKTFSDLHITEQIAPSGNLCKRDILSDIKTADNVVGIDDNLEDPQLCATFACDIYKHLRASETKKRPSIDFMEKIQQDINASMRSILIDWLVEVSEEYRLVPDTLYLTVNYVDRYLSGNSMNRQRLQLLGVACMMIAAKFEEICAPQVEEYCYITDNTYFKEEVLQMESAVLSFLKFEMTAPTVKCFLRRFVRAAQACSEASPMHLECLSNYIAELSLLEYHMLQYAPSVIAASSIFLAKYILSPSKRPWNSTLQHYTLYQPSQLQDCVQALHKLFLNNGHSSSLPAVREKYSHHKYKYVAKKYCPPTIPPEYFSNASSK